MNTVVIGILYRTILKPLFFAMDPEIVHERMIRFGHFLGQHQITRSWVRWLFYFHHPSLQQTVAGIRFKNPVGLAAGFDKNAQLTQIAQEVGFGAIEVGTITALPYAGNPKPRLARLTRSHGLLVNYGLKNEGADAIVPKIIKNKQSQLIVGISIGKTNSPETASSEKGIDDYCACMKKVIASGKGDFYTINISCPNTFGGEPFTTPDRLSRLLNKLSTIKRTKPIFLKMPINLAWADFAKLLNVAVNFEITGVIIGNLNKNRSDPAIKDVIGTNLKGGVSGRPTRELSNELISRTFQKYRTKLIIVGCGGIFCAEDAYEKIKRGASLVQLVTGMIYEGPQLIGNINRKLVLFLARDGYTSIQQTVGAYHTLLER